MSRVTRREFVDSSRTCREIVSRRDGGSPTVSPIAIVDLSPISTRLRCRRETVTLVIVVSVEIGTDKPGAGPVFSHARVTRPPTTKVTRRPVATPAWRVARRVLERGRRDATDDVAGESTTWWWGSGPTGEEEDSTGPTGWKATGRERMEENGGIRGVESYQRKGEGRGDAVPTAPLHPRIKNRSASPIRALFTPRSCVVSADPRGMLRSLRNTDILHYRHRNAHSALIQTDNTPRQTAHRDPRGREEINKKSRHNDPEK